MMFVPHRKHTYGPPRPVTEMALLYFTLLYFTLLYMPPGQPDQCSNYAIGYKIRARSLAAARVFLFSVDSRPAVITPFFIAFLHIIYNGRWSFTSSDLEPATFGVINIILESTNGGEEERV
jgi:hypothetical protein